MNAALEHSTPAATPPATPAPPSRLDVGPAVATPTPAQSPHPAVAASTTQGVHFGSTLDRSAVMAGGSGTVRMELRIASEHEARAGVRRATDLVVVLDESGSMSGEKIRDARRAAHELLAQLGDKDRFALVSFDSDVQLRIPLGYATRDRLPAMTRAIDGISAGGGTEMQAGLAAGSEQHRPVPGRAARTILISDGLPNSPDGLVDQARGFARSEVPLTTVGIGADYDEQLMVALADAGTGNFYQVTRGQDLAAVFGHELSTAQETVATGLQVGLELGEGVELVDASGYPTRVVGGRVVFDVGTLYAGQERSFWVTLAVPASTLGDRRVAMPSLTWHSAETTDTASVTLEPSSVEVVQEQQRFLAGIDADAWGRSVIEEEYNVLRSQVSRAVQAGDLATAKATIQDYTDRNRALNEHLDNQAVWDNFAEVAAMEQQVARQFEGEGQQTRQNLLSKTLNSLSYSGRRQGQAKGY